MSNIIRITLIESKIEAYQQMISYAARQIEDYQKLLEAAQKEEEQL